MGQLSLLVRSRVMPVGREDKTLGLIPLFALMASQSDRLCMVPSTSTTWTSAPWKLHLHTTSSSASPTFAMCSMVPSVYYNYFYNVLLGSISKSTAILCHYQISHLMWTVHCYKQINHINRIVSLSYVYRERLFHSAINDIRISLTFWNMIIDNTYKMHAEKQIWIKIIF